MTPDGLRAAETGHSSNGAMGEGPRVVGQEDALTLYRLMYLARRFEESLADIFAGGQLAGWLHSCIGHEAIGAAFALILREGDYLVPYHRSRASLFAKGMSARDVAAELMARGSAQSRGRGGDGHIVHPALRIGGMSGSLGASVPIAAGMAYAAKLRDAGEVVLSAFGDGTANRGAVHEGINLAAIWALPVVFVCENNMYAEFSPIRDQMGAEHVIDRAPGYGVPGVIVDGNDPEAVLAVLTGAVDRARSGEGPTLIEAKTYRLRGHYEGDPQAYRDKEEIAAWVQRDPVPRFRARLGELGVEDDVVTSLESEVDAEVADAMQWALAEPLPPAEQLSGDVYAQDAEDGVHAVSSGVA